VSALVGGTLKELLPEIHSVQTEMHMSIDKSRHDHPIAQVNHNRRSAATNRSRDLGNDTVLDQDFGRPGERIF
jgi:hypothetical protein